MKKHINYIILLIATLLLTACSSNHESTSSTENYEGIPTTIISAEVKSSFAKQAEDDYAIKQSNQNIQVISKEEKKELIANAITSSYQISSEINLERYGIYLLPLEYNASVTSQSNVVLSAPYVFYDASTDEWIVTCSGYWTGNQYDMKDGTVGTADSFGIRYNETNDTYDSYVVDTYASICDENFKEYVTTDYRSDGDGSNGFKFTLQDYYDSESNIYVGYHWFGLCIYDANFASYDFSATSFYEHTY